MIGCTKEKAKEIKKTTTTTDEQLLEEAAQTNLSYYQNGNLLDAASGSPHGSFKLRFNATAKNVLEKDGELPAGKQFPEGSLIVKDIYKGGKLTLYAIMKKTLSDDNTGNGWLWNEIEPNGTVVFSVGKRGNGCISCHSQIPNRDLIRVFDEH